MELAGAAEARILSAGYKIPEPLVPIASYASYVRSGSIVFISGQVSTLSGRHIRGRVGQDVSVAQAIEASHFCGLNIIAQIKAACNGDLDRVKRVLKLQGFVQCTQDFQELALVMNGCSDLMKLTFDENGEHARSTIGVYALPRGFAVEVDAIIEVDVDE